MKLILNHKVNLSIRDIKRYEKVLKDLDVIVLPQIPYLGLFTDGIYHLGSQYISTRNVTGSISALALKGMNVEYVLVGHHEHRKEDNDYILADKVNLINDNNMIPIICVGETKEERERNKSFIVLEKQIIKLFNNIRNINSNVVVVYQAPWTTNFNNAELKHINEIIIFIKSLIKDNFGVNLNVLYSGNVTSENIDKIISNVILDGFMIGKSSLDLNEVLKIYNKIN